MPLSLPAWAEGLEDLKDLLYDKYGIDAYGFLEARGGLRLRDDPHEKDASIGEMRLQTDLSRDFELAELKISDVEAVETYVIATVPSDPNGISINLQGPILINTDNNLAKQLVMVNSHYQVNHTLMELLAEMEETSTVTEPEPVGV